LAGLVAARIELALDTARNFGRANISHVVRRALGNGHRRLRGDGYRNRRTEIETRAVDPCRPGTEPAGFNDAALTFVLKGDHVRSDADGHEQRSDAGKLAVPFGHLLAALSRRLIGSGEYRGQPLRSS